MSVIGRSAYFSLCEECGEHGHIVCVSGKRSLEFATVSEGKRELTDLVTSGEIAEDEMLAVKAQIEESELEHTNEELDKRLRELSRLHKKLDRLLGLLHSELDAREGALGSTQHRRTLH